MVSSSNIATVAVGSNSVTVPANPSEVNGYVSNSNVYLSWTDNSSNELYFQVSRRSGGLPNGSVDKWVALGQTGVNVTTYVDLSVSGTYEYGV